MPAVIPCYLDPVDGFEGERYMRKERREAVLMIIIAVIFTGLGVFLWVVAGNLWMGLTGIAFSVSLVAAAIAKMNRSHTASARIGALVGCLAFGITGAVMIASTFTDTMPFGNRQLPALIAGILCLVFFGGGFVLLLIREIQRVLAPRNRTRR